MIFFFFVNHSTAAFQRKIKDRMWCHHLLGKMISHITSNSYMVSLTVKQNTQKSCISERPVTPWARIGWDLPQAQKLCTVYYYYYYIIIYINIINIYINIIMGQTKWEVRKNQKLVCEKGEGKSKCWWGWTTPLCTSKYAETLAQVVPLT